MSKQEFAYGTPAKEAMLLVCDAAGRVQAVSGGTASNAFPCVTIAQKHFAELFGRESNITRWLTQHLNEARRKINYQAEASLENGSEMVFVRLESLKCDDEHYGFALQLLPGDVSAKGNTLDEGDAVVFRKQWHEIKNHIGALKLYATFLTRKMPDGDERQTVEKMLNGINVLIEYLAKIRRGDAQ
jgi:nitrogen-specific signal transduction histidine kinase